MSKERIITEITKEEFCKATKTTENCWLFNESESEPSYQKDSEDGREDWYIFDNKEDRLYRFKDMPMYGEIWASRAYQNSNGIVWSMWNTWKQY